MRQAQRRAIRNQAARSAVRTYFKKASVAVANTTEDAAETVLKADLAMDRAEQGGIILCNAAARGKSVLMTRLHQLSIAPAADATSAAAKADTKPGARKSAAKASTAKKPTARKPAAKKP